MRGGADGKNSLSSVEVFDFNTNTFAGIGNMSIPRMRHTATLLSGVTHSGGEHPTRSGHASGHLFARADWYFRLVEPPY